MRPATFLITTAAALASANPLPDVQEITPGTTPNIMNNKALWKVDFKNAKWCEGPSDATLSSENPNSRCLKYNNGWDREVDSIMFQHPKGDKNCKYGCEKCKINVYYSPAGEKADCCDQHKVKRDWSKPDVGKCIDINPPPGSRVRYQVECE